MYDSIGGEHTCSTRAHIKAHKGLEGRRLFSCNKILLSLNKAIQSGGVASRLSPGRDLKIEEVDKAKRFGLWNFLSNSICENQW